jgi:hypothetical protein
MTTAAPDSSEAGFKDRFFDYFKQEAAGKLLIHGFDHLILTFS